MIPTASDPVATLVFFLVVFGVVGAFFLFIHLVMGSVIRPDKPDDEKLTIYECGEPTVGSAWVQFDLRYYVVALLFVIFDVEVAFFFPWATVFGTANQIAAIPEGSTAVADVQLRQKLSEQMLPSGLSNDARIKMGLESVDKTTGKSEVVPIKSEVAASWAKVAFLDILIFFSVLMVGFAYVWRRGDINWVRAYPKFQEPAIAPEKPLEQQKIVA